MVGCREPIAAGVSEFVKARGSEIASPARSSIMQAAGHGSGESRVSGEHDAIGREALLVERLSRLRRKVFLRPWGGSRISPSSHPELGPWAFFLRHPAALRPRAPQPS